MSDGDVRRVLVPSGSETRPTPAGVLLLAATALAAWFAALADPASVANGAGSPRLLLAAVAALGAAVFIVAQIDLRRRTRGLRVDPPEPGLAVARETFVLDAGILNEAGSAESFDLVLSVRVPGGAARAGALLVSLPAGTEERVLVRVAPLRRGRHPQGTLEVSSSALLGLLTRRLRFELPHDVLVLPRIGSVRGLDVRTASSRQQSVRSGLRRRDEEEFHGLRAWREGEGLRHIRWKASARRGRLLVQEFRGEPRSPVHVVLDTLVRPRGAAAFESAVSVAATLVEHHLRLEHPVRATILGTDAAPLPGGRGRQALLPALRVLAEVAATPRSGAAAKFPALDARAGERTFVVRVGGEGSARTDAPAGALILDVADSSIAAVYHPATHGATARLLAGIVHAAPSVGAVAAPRTSREESHLRTLGRIAVGLLFALTVAVAWKFGSAGSRVVTLVGLGAALAVLSGGISRLLGRRRRHERAADLLILWAAPLLAVLTATIADSVVLALSVPAALALLLAGLSQSQAVDAGAACPRVARAGAPSEGAADGVPARRLRSGFLATVPALAIAVPLALLLLVLPRVRGDTVPARSGAAGESRGGEWPQGGGLRMVVDPSSSGGPRADVPWDEKRVLIEVQPIAGGGAGRRPAGHQGALYLRGTILDAIDGAGVWSEAVGTLRQVRDADDGAADGWCRIGRSPAPASALHLAVRQYVIEHALTGNCVAHVPAGVAAVEFPEVVAAPEGVVLLARTRGLLQVDYRVEARHPWKGPFPTDRSVVADRDGDALSVPDRHPVYLALAGEALTATSEAATDLGKVRAVVRHLRKEFEYEQIDDPRTDIDSLYRFLNERKGACVQFAQAAALMLRRVGVPARVATGFLVREWDTSRKLYLGRGRDYHAWIEVDFEGCGWVTFDPTPEASEPDMGPTNAPALLGDEADEGDEGLDALVGMLEDAALRGAEAVREDPWWLLLSVLVLPVLLLLARAVVRRGAQRAGAERGAAGGARPESTAWRDLLSALARRGHRRRSSQTALEFAAVVLAAEGERAADFCALTLRQQEARFGARPLTSEDDVAIAAFAASFAAE